jgi:hypothetical protein
MYAINLSGGVDNNYVITLVNGTLTIDEPSPPLIISINVNSGLAVVTWTSVAGLQYKLQYKDEITGLDWADASAIVLAFGPTTSEYDVVGFTPHRFYRVVLVTPF